MKTKQQAVQALKMIADGIVDSVREADRGQGVPGGPIYLALMAHGCTYNQFPQIMAALVAVGKLTQSGDCYRVM